nr:EpsG family protein [Pedobacter panaciterrae]
MLILSFVFIILIILSIFDLIEVSQVYKDIILIGIAITLVILAASRFNDRDYHNYIEIFELSPKWGSGFSYNDELHGEPGYIFINSFIKSIGLGYTTVFGLVATLSVSLNLIFYRKNTNFVLIALLIYFSHVFLLRDMMQIRSGLAASISLFALCHVESRRFLRFSVLILIAALFHSGVLLLFIGYVLYPYYLRNRWLKYVMILLGLILGLILNQGFFEFIFSSVLNIPAVSTYLYESEYFSSLGLLNPVLIKNVILLCVLIYFSDDIAGHVPNFSVLLMFFVIGIFWLSAFNNFSIIAARIATYFSNVEHILLPSLFYLKANKFVLWFIVVVYCAYMFSSKFQIFEDLTFIFL